MSINELTINVMTELDMYRAIDIIDTVLGKDYVDADNFKSMLTDGAFQCLVAKAGEEVAGVAIGAVFEKQAALEFMRISSYPCPAVVKPSDYIGVVKTVAVSPNFQKRGIGTRLVYALEKGFLRKNVRVAACVAWRHGTEENIGGVLAKNQYRSVRIIENYWREESLAEGFSCPVCGEPPCQCSANIYFKALNEPNETTYAAMEESERLLEDLNAKRFSSIEELFEDLDA